MSWTSGPPKPALCRFGVAAAAAAALMIVPATAAAQQAEAARTGPQASAAETTAPGDSHVLTGAKARRASRIIGRSSASAGLFTTPTEGYRIPVEVSNSYNPRDRRRWQTFVNLLDSVDHNTELRLIKLFIGPPAEVARICGGDETTLACYDPADNRLIVPGSDAVLDGERIPKEPSIVHEYGHHIAVHRNNDPWDAYDFGAKNWATYSSVCNLVRRNILAPGAQGERYFDDPGEGFAEGYAWSQGYRSAQWDYNRRLLPDSGTFQAIRLDVLQPWAGNEVRRFRGRLSRFRRSKRFILRQPYDGALRMRLLGPRRANFAIRLIKGGRRVRQTRRRGSRDTLRYRWCSTTAGLQDIVIKVVRRSGSGRFRLRVSWPG